MTEIQLLGEETAKNPNLETAQLKFTLTLPEHATDKDRKEKLLEIITADCMAPYYKLVCDELKWKVDKKLLKEMSEKNEQELKALDKDIELNRGNLGVIELKDAYLNKANYLSSIGEKEETLKALTLAYDNTVSIGYKIDNIFHCAKIGLFFMDLDLVKRSLQRCEILLEQGADWHNRNCYKIYRGLYALCTRDFAQACDNLLGAVATFICTELISFDDFIKYTVFSAMLTLSRSELKKGVIENPDVLQVLHSNPALKEYVFSLYACEYKHFFVNLADVEMMMREDMFLNPHYKFYVREMKIKAYNQLLSTYISVSLSYMAKQFGVTSEYIEKDISNFIVSGRLNYKIDKVDGKVVNLPSDKKNELYKDLVKQGDLLLNRIHKLSRVINI